MYIFRHFFWCYWLATNDEFLSSSLCLIREWWTFLQIILIESNDKVIDFSKRKPALFPCSLIQLYNSCWYSAFDEHNRRYVVLAANWRHANPWLSPPLLSREINRLREWGSRAARKCSGGDSASGQGSGGQGPPVSHVCSTDSFPSSTLSTPLLHTLFVFFSGFLLSHKNYKGRVSFRCVGTRKAGARVRGRLADIRRRCALWRAAP